tara:strand:- start:5416 stop:6309 length:894 start_codon:yes stop_codon:yes gene_type:complete
MLNNGPITAASLISSDPDPFKWRMGVKPLELANWLLLDEQRSNELEEIGQLIDRYRDNIIYCEPSATQACEELAAEVLEHLRHLPGLASIDIDKRPASLIEAIRRIVQEDVCVLEKRPSGWTMTACAVAIPTQWDVASKFGKTLDTIHEPVPRYDSDLSQTMSTFFDRLRPEKPVWRANRTLTDDPSLRLEPKRRHQPMRDDVTVNNVADQVWLRVEYQTLRRLARSDAIIFTIRILRQTIRSVADHPEALGELLRSVSRLPADVRDYKDSTARHAELIKEWALSTGTITKQSLQKH